MIEKFIVLLKKIFSTIETQNISILDEEITAEIIIF